ncbi:uncharacterized protein LOC128739750 [Sabethes cyaneus]|uniref:uncharacterized protein LOC128739750 n=1 Tax=Sabethes cyaneus TaxID=53552 RepID=UPI00237EAA93|nr:uncharacterized protein LOC128739750 [Sabethes cyaneus]
MSTDCEIASRAADAGWKNGTFFLDVVAADLQIPPEYFQIIDLKVANVASKIVGYMSLTHRVTITVDIGSETRQRKVLSYVVKEKSDMVFGGEMVDDLIAFPKEIDVYSKILPAFEQLCLDDKEKFGPRLFKSTSSRYTVLVMEDLKTLGFSMKDCGSGLNVTECEQVLQKLAKFHAASVVHYEQNGTYSDNFKDGMFADRLVDQFEEYYSQLYKSFVWTLEEMRFPEHVLNTLRLWEGKMYSACCKLLQYDPAKFNVLNHGDCWINNLQFCGNNVLMVDYQIAFYGTPSFDLIYFIITSAAVEVRTEMFDHLVKHYHCHLVQSLQQMGAKTDAPSLQVLEKDITEHGLLACILAMEALAFMLAMQGSEVKMDLITSEEPDAVEYRKTVYSNIHTNGELEPKEVEVVAESGNPTWLNEAFFEDIFVDKLQLEQGKFKVKIKSIVATGGAGENYTSKLYRADVDAECEDGSSKTLKLLLKAMITNPGLKAFSVFIKEKFAYEQLLPKLEQLWAANGESVSFGPRCWKTVDGDVEIIALDDLCAKGYKVANRQVGADWDHARILLAKLAKFHAAGAVDYRKNGPINPLYNKGMVQEEGKALFEQYVKAVEPVFLKSMEAWPGHEKYQNKMVKALQGLFYKMKEATAKDDSGFVTLCHGDVWTNNHMYSYRETGEPKDALLIDYQGPYYGSPACDLYYYIISSTTLDLKTSQFDELIQYYHECLADSLQKLDYPERIPSLRDFRIDLLKRGFFATQSLFGILPIVLADKNENANFDGFFGEAEENVKFRLDVYNNSLYQQHLEPMLKLFDVWGLLE